MAKNCREGLGGWIRLIFLHESYNEVEVRLHTENQLPWYSGSGLNQMGKVQQQQQHIVYVGTCCAGYTHLFKLIIQPTQLGFGLSLAGVWQKYDNPKLHF